MALKFKKLILLALPLFFLLASNAQASEETVDGATLYTYQATTVDGTAFLKGTNGIIYPQGAAKIDEIYLFFHGTNPPACVNNDCHLIDPMAVCKEFKLCEKVTIRQSIKGKTKNDTEIPRKNIAILVPQMDAKSGENASIFTEANFAIYLQEALAQLHSKIPNSPNSVVAVIGHREGVGIMNEYLKHGPVETVVVFDGCYKTWCEKIYRASITRKYDSFFYISSETDTTNSQYNTLHNFFANNPGESQQVQKTGDHGSRKVLKLSTGQYQIPEQCFLDHVLNDSCKSATPKQPASTDLDTILADINAAKPKLEIDFPGIQFATVTINNDEVGNSYVIIPWIAQFISALYKFGIAISSIVAVVIIILQGARIIISGGGEQKTEGYKKIGHALIGLVIAWGSFAILYNINPNLVEFNGLRVKVVEEIPLDTNDIILDDTEGNTPSTIPSGEYDFIFKQYANCVGINWQILRMIAKAESNLTPDLVNRAGFIGFFQTKPKNCRGVFGKKYARYADLCTEENLKTPAFNTAVGALYQKNALSLINTYCKDAPINVQLTVFYSILSSGEGATKSVLKSAQKNGGCTEKNLRDGFTKFWHDYKGGNSARWFIDYMEKNNPTYCQDFADKLNCMGTKKFDHTLKAANKLVNQGINSVSAQPTGACPLDTDTPFPSL